MTQGEELDPPAVDAGAGRASLRSGMGFAATSFAANAFVQLLSAVLTARLYGVDTIGEYALVIAPWLTLIQFSSISEHVALVRELSHLPARDRRVGRLFFPVFGFSTVLTIVVGVIVMGFSAVVLDGPIERGDLIAPAFAVLVAYVLVENVSWNFDAVFSAFRAGRELFAARLAQALTFLVVAVALYYVSGSVWSLTVATIASFVVGLAIRTVLVRRFLALVPLREVREGMRELPDLLRFAAKLVPGSIANGLQAQAATWLLGSLSSVRVVGSYSRAAGVAARIQDAGFRLNEIVFPSMVERHRRGDDDGMRADLSLALRGAAIPLLFLTAVGGGVAESALEVFGDGFGDAADAFTLLLLTYSIGVLVMMLGNVTLAIGQPWMNTKFVVVRAVLTLVLIVPGVIWFDATGAAAAALIAHVVDFAARLVHARRVFHQGFGKVGRTLVATVAAGVPAYAIARVLDRSLVTPLGAVAGVVAGSAVYAAVLIGTGGVSLEEVRRFVAGARDRLRRG